MSRAARRDDGFTLVEVVVALAIVMVVAASLLPQLVAGIQATSTARTISQAKGVVQGQLDRMRNLPYYVSRQRVTTRTCWTTTSATRVSRK